MKKIRHWLHILLVLITGGIWLPVYLIIVSTTEMYNRGYRAGVIARKVELNKIYGSIADDAYAASFQSLGQYRKALLEQAIGD